MTVFAYVPDVFDRSKLERVVDQFLPEPVVLRHTAIAAGDVVIVDLGRDGVLEVAAELAKRGVRIIGFGPHVDQELLDAARAAGCAVVLPRSRFFADPAAVIRE